MIMPLPPIGNIADYNNYYGTGAYVGYLGRPKTTIADLRVKTNQALRTPSVFHNNYVVLTNKTLVIGWNTSSACL